ncbi:MAG: hypothetical protein MRJ93_11455 [Nitrososphaeraceae archaeon]|nr:hypothetical protein [Nitrososphaeraceae archaeon]
MITQCTDCSNTGKKDQFCDKCIKVADYFDVFQYTNDVDNKELVGRIKAYRWKDALDYVKKSFFADNFDLVTNCEKDFAFVEKKFDKEKVIGYKLYLNPIHGNDKITLWNLT